jgi:putative endonuclease
MHERSQFGRWGEKAAAAYLTHQGYEILARNYHCRYGELDIVAREGNEIVFVEVKSRRSDSFGSPASAVDARKVLRLRRTARDFLYRYRRPGESYRFDVIEIITLFGSLHLNHLKHYF